MTRFCPITTWDVTKSDGALARSVHPRGQPTTSGRLCAHHEAERARLSEMGRVVTTNDQGEHTPARNKHAITPERSFAWLVHRRPHLAGVGVMSKAAWMAVMSA